MIDFIIGVKDPVEWHEENLRKNPTHYSFLRRFPKAPKLISHIQEEYPSYLYFNTLIPIFDTVCTNYNELILNLLN